MKIKMIIILFVMITMIMVMSMVFVSAVQPTQQFNKIYLNPFYRNAMTSGTNYTYNVTISPPDKISSVTSAIISFDVYITPSVNFSLWVNNQVCNTPSYYISTTYAGSGQSRITFDCSNIINKEGNYQIILKPTLANTGAISGWIDLTYMNNPKGSMEISGTEYSPNDLATMFVQLKDSQGLAINDGTCYIDVWYPSTTNSSHSYTIQDAPMMKAQGDDGIYYYDLVAPSILGVYMLSAKCSYAYSGGFVYDMSGVETNKPNRTIIQGTYAGDTIFLNDFEDWIYTSCASTGGATKYCEGYFDFDTKIHFSNITNFTNINLFYMGEASSKANMFFQIWNWTSSSWVYLPNNLTFSGLASSVPVGIGDFASNPIPTNYNNTFNSEGIIRIKTITYFGNSFSLYSNCLNIELKNANGEIQDVKGSGEMHITNIPNATANQVWNYNGTINTNILSQFSNSIWNLFNSTYNFINLIVEGTWTRTNRNLTYYETSSSGSNLTASDVWNYGTRELTYYPTSNFSVNGTDIATQVWSYGGTINSNILTQVAEKVQCYLNNLFGEANSEWAIDISSC